MIVDKITYQDCYDEIDQNMSDSQIGGRRNRNIRNNLFILYSIINNVKFGNAAPVDVTAYDVEKWFDSLWLKDCINDLHDSGIKDDRLALVYESNRNNKISINVPAVGETEPIDIGEVVMQGSSWGSIMCSNSVGDIGGDTMTRAKNISDPPPHSCLLYTSPSPRD